MYGYQDAKGWEVFQVVRYHFLNGPGKTFRQRIYAPGKPGANRDGYINTVPAELRDSTIYRMPQVLQAIRYGKPVYIVEGEKDVETMERLGFTATCNPGGADEKASKWKPGHSERLRGADVIILPDNDSKGNKFTGQEHAWHVATFLLGIAKRVRLVDIRQACPELPEKGDISDMVAIMGDVPAMDALARQVAATRDFDVMGVPFWLTPQEQAERLYSRIPGYGAMDGCITQVVSEGTEKKLSDFIVIPRMELIKDDGVNTSLNFVLDGWNGLGRKLERVEIRAGDLDSMSWVTEKWGFSASLAPGTTTKGKVAWAIKKVGQATAQRVTEYNHSGWRKIGGEWCYLYQGGAIGREGVTVDMGDTLKGYRLDGSGAAGFDAIDPVQAAMTSYQMQQIMSEEVGIALLGVMYLAPLREFMTMTDIHPAFAVYMYGEGGTHKSTAAALALSHFGNFHAKNLPASFNDTGNQIRRKAFTVKDMPIVIDDFHPVSSVQERRIMASTAQTLSRAFGDGVDRGRLNADRSIAANMPPRSVAIITGEDLPAIGASGLARYFILDIDRGDIPVGDQLTEMQEKARDGYLQKAMRGYIEWLLGQTDQLPEWLHRTFLAYRSKVHTDGAQTGQHDRAPEAVACILIGYTMMLRYFQSLGIFDAQTCLAMVDHARSVLEDVSRQQSRDTEGEKPTRIFLDTLAELLNSHKVVLHDLTVVDGRPPSVIENMVGYMDADYYYLLPNVAYSAVARLCRDQGQEFPVSLKALYKHLRTDGILEGIGKEDKATRPKWIGGKLVRVLWIPAKMLNGPKASAVQERMDFTETNEATPFDK